MSFSKYTFARAQASITFTVEEHYVQVVRRCVLCDFSKIVNFRFPKLRKMFKYESLQSLWFAVHTVKLLGYLLSLYMFLYIIEFKRTGTSQCSQNR